MEVLEKPFLSVEDMNFLLGYKKAKSYSVIKELNKELAEQGYMTCNGRVPTKYFIKRFGILGGQSKK